MRWRVYALVYVQNDRDKNIYVVGSIPTVGDTIKGKHEQNLCFRNFAGNGLWFVAGMFL